MVLVPIPHPRPEVNREYLLEMDLKDKTCIAEVKRFAIHCIKELGIKGPVRLILAAKQTGMPTAGYFDVGGRTVFAAVKNRAMADIMRTIAHELTHCKQLEDGVDFPDDDEGLQPYEDIANQKSGFLVRFYGRKNRQIYNDLT